jgi:hypothetical protein
MAIIKGIELANDLRKLADAVEGLEEVVTFSTPRIFLGFAYGNEKHKNGFIEFAKIMPKPFEKKFTEHELQLIYKSEALEVQAYIERDKVCKIVKPAQPAVYDCEALLSQAEIAQLGAAETESAKDEINF